jgi:hypothetical protein
MPTDRFASAQEGENRMDSKLSIRNGMPTGEFLSEAWRDETLNVGLPGIYAPVAFAPSDPAMSLVATMDGSLVGQCASHRVAEYWEHAMLHGERGPNDSTRCVRKIHTRVVALQMRFLQDHSRTSAETMHSNGIAVIPRMRGQGISKAMRARQIEVVKEYNMTGLFCETTSQYGAGTITPFSPELLAEFPSKDLARDWNAPRLAAINDSFKVWYKRV